MKNITINFGRQSQEYVDCGCGHIVDLIDIFLDYFTNGLHFRPGKLVSLCVRLRPTQRHKIDSKEGETGRVKNEYEVWMCECLYMCTTLNEAHYFNAKINSNNCCRTKITGKSPFSMCPSPITNHCTCTWLHSKVNEDTSLSIWLNMLAITSLINAVHSSHAVLSMSIYIYIHIHLSHSLLFSLTSVIWNIIDFLFENVSWKHKVTHTHTYIQTSFDAWYSSHSHTHIKFCTAT